MAKIFFFGMISGIQLGDYLMSMGIELYMMQDMILDQNYLLSLRMVLGTGLVPDLKLLSLFRVVFLRWSWEVLIK
jgi:hypothetical protein